MIVAGERRYRAALAAGLKHIPATIRQLTDEQALEIQITENLLRKDVHPLEEAVGFKSLYETLTIEQISNRVGKSAGFVAKRIKLADLVPDGQTIFFRGHMNLEQAQMMCRLSPEDQEAVLKECLPKDWKTRKGEWEIQQVKWAVNKQMVELRDAKFKTNDAKLYPEAGACTKCPHNSANQPLLFDDMKGKHCTKPTCFAIKQQRALKAKMEELASNPDLVCVTGYIYNDEDKAKVAAAKEMGITILDDKMYESHYEIEPEWPDFDTWVQDEYDTEDEDYNEEEAKEEYESAKKIWEEDIAEQNAAIAEGRIIKAYIIAGRDEGEEKLIKLRSTAKALVENATGNGDDSAIKFEITKIKMREDRNKELDREKIFAAATEEYKKWDTPVELSKVDKIAMIIHLMNNDWSVRDYLNQIIKVDKSDYRLLEAFNKLKALQGPDISTLFIKVIGVYLQSNVPSKEFYDYQKHGKAAAYYDIFNYIFPSELSEIQSEIAEKASKREANVQKRIAALRKKAEKENAPAE
jgi:ParB family chromosome partitioning protein